MNYPPEDPVRNWHGRVSEVNFDAAVIRFHYGGEPAVAMAMVDVCYNGYGAVRNLNSCRSYAPGKSVHFDAILDQNGPLPAVWKVAVAWTASKPRSSEVLHVYRDLNKILDLYQHSALHTGLLQGYTGVPDKDLDMEDEMVQYYSYYLYLMRKEGVVYNIEEDDLELLLDEMDPSFKDYVAACHKTMRDFFEYHYPVFIRRDDHLYVCKHNQVFQYLEEDLPLKLIEEARGLSYNEFVPDSAFYDYDH